MNNNKQKKIKISIITIVYNDVYYIEKTMKSVLDQNYSNIEYILIDGNSSDGTVDIIKKYISVFEKKGITTFFLSEPDKGISDAFNKGIRHATGDIIGLINSGDGLMPDALKILVENWKSEDEIVYGKTLAIDDKYNLRYLRQIPDHQDLSKMVYTGMIFTHQSAFVKREVYNQFGLYDISFRYIMDLDLFIHFYNSGVQFRYIDELLVSMLCNGISSRASIPLIKEKIRISKKYNGSPAVCIWLKYFINIPKRMLTDLLRKNPRLWYLLIGRRRCVDK